MALPVYLSLTANGNEIQGESSVTSLGRENSIECLYFYFSGMIPTSTSAGGAATGKRRYDPIRIQKVIDKSSPLLLKAFTHNEKIEGTFRFYRQNPEDGATEQFYTVEISNARIIGVAQFVNQTYRTETANDPPLEEVSFLFQNVTWTYTDGGVSHSDSVSGRG